MEETVLSEIIKKIKQGEIEGANQELLSLLLSEELLSLSTRETQEIVWILWDDTISELSYNDLFFILWEQVENIGKEIPFSLSQQHETLFYKSPEHFLRILYWWKPESNSITIDPFYAQSLWLRLDLYVYENLSGEIEVDPILYTIVLKTLFILQTQHNFVWIDDRVKRYNDREKQLWETDDDTYLVAKSIVNNQD